MQYINETILLFLNVKCNIFVPKISTISNYQKSIFYENTYIIMIFPKGI